MTTKALNQLYKTLIMSSAVIDHKLQEGMQYFPG